MPASLIGPVETLKSLLSPLRFKVNKQKLYELDDSLSLLISTNQSLESELKIVLELKEEASQLLDEIKEKSNSYSETTENIEKKLERVAEIVEEEEIICRI